ncbi:Zinc finger CCCH domain-containing protein 11A [Cucumispora dikerogammari]|nr:Zinc finger CCCH domain-containing protein 11A [Cucumispora dikerogammari]
MNYNNSPEHNNYNTQRKNRHVIDHTNPNQQDCYYFLYSKCDRPSCPFRHSIEARTTQEICPLYQRKVMCNGACMKRHSTYHLERKRDSIMCYFDTNDQCRKPNCEYQHRNPKRNIGNQILNQRSSNFDLKDTNSKTELEEDFVSRMEKLNVAKKNIEKSNLSESEKQEIIDRILQELRRGGF